MTEIFGYAASFFVAISLLMSSFLWLRVLNLIGAVSFVVYGSLLGTIPVVITNAFIVCINIYYLVQMFRPDLNGVSYVPIDRARRQQLDDFIAFYLDDILKFFPDFSTRRIDECFSSGGRAYLALKDLRVVGFALVHPVPRPDEGEQAALAEVYRHIGDELFPDRSAVVSVDYIIRKYRGLGLAHRLYDTIEKEEGEGVSFLLAPVEKKAKQHRRFLVRHGFSLQREFTGYDLYGKGIGT